MRLAPFAHPGCDRARVGAKHKAAAVPRGAGMRGGGHFHDRAVEVENKHGRVSASYLTCFLHQRKTDRSGPRVTARAMQAGSWDRGSNRTAGASRWRAVRVLHE